MRSRSVTVGRALAAGLVLPLLMALPATAARADEVLPRPSDGVFQIEGHGWGHGHGMSQWGAYGAAESSKNWTQIVGFYYPGTRRYTVTAAVRLRVLISADTDGDLRVRPASGLRASARGQNRTLPTTRDGYPVHAWRVRSRSDGLHLEGWSDGAWRRYWIGTHKLFHDSVTFSDPAHLLRLVLPNGTRRDYRGFMRAALDGSTLRTVNLVKMQAYLRSVVPEEMPASWATPALKSQAVAARTYAFWKRANSATSTYDICDTTSCQVYSGVRALTSTNALIAQYENSRTTSAVGMTAGRVLTYGGAYAFTEFSASNGGYSVQGSAPYLVAKPDPYDGVVQSSASTHYWMDFFTAHGVHSAYPSVGRVTKVVITSRDGHGEWGGRIIGMTVVGEKGSRTTSGADFAHHLALRTPWWRGRG